MKNRKIRYAVVGLGHISQVAVLPAFAHALKNSTLQALVSDDEAKLKSLGRRYKVPRLHTYEEFDECLRSGEIDAVYIALPNHLHRDFTVRAARAGVHVLCEKPMEVSSRDCREMIDATDRAGVKLMIAYRLHFEEANLRVIEALRKGRIGDPRVFNSVFTLAVKDRNIRTSPREQGGGPLYDIGIYCLNAARSVFQGEPVEVTATEFRREGRSVFERIEESMAVTLRFPGDRVANFVCSYGTVATGSYEVLGTKGSLRLDNAYEYVGDRSWTLNVQGRETRRVFKSTDQFAPELLYFSDCILRDRVPEPSGLEGLADIRIIEAAFRSARLGRAVPLRPIPRKPHPRIVQLIRRPAVSKPPVIHAEKPSKKAA